MAIESFGQQYYKGGQDLAEAKRIIGVINRAAWDLAAVDDKKPPDREPGMGKVSVKDYVQDSKTGRTYSGSYSYNPESGEKKNLDIYLKGDVYDDPDWMGVDYSFTKGGTSDLYKRVDRVDFYITSIEEARVNTTTGAIKFDAYKQDLTPPPFPPYPPIPPHPPIPPFPH